MSGNGRNCQYFAFLMEKWGNRILMTVYDCGKPSEWRRFSWGKPCAGYQSKRDLMNRQHGCAKDVLWILGIFHEPLFLSNDVINIPWLPTMCQAPGSSQLLFLNYSTDSGLTLKNWPFHWLWGKKGILFSGLGFWKISGFSEIWSRDLHKNYRFWPVLVQFAKKTSDS